MLTGRIMSQHVSRILRATVCWPWISRHTHEHNNVRPPQPTWAKTWNSGLWLNFSYWALFIYYSNAKRRRTEFSQTWRLKLTVYFTLCILDPTYRCIVPFWKNSATVVAMFCSQMKQSILNTPPLQFALLILFLLQKDHGYCSIYNHLSCQTDKHDLSQTNLK